MQCPKCLEGDMTPVSDTVNVSRCSHCHGLYFEALTQQLLDDISPQLNIDIGDETMGEAFNATVYFECPKCEQIMDHRSLAEPVQIQFEICIACHGTFLDAGELRTCLSDDYRDEFRALLPPE